MTDIIGNDLKDGKYRQQTSIDKNMFTRNGYSGNTTQTGRSMNLY